MHLLIAAAVAALLLSTSASGNEQKSALLEFLDSPESTELDKKVFTMMINYAMQAASLGFNRGYLAGFSASSGEPIPDEVARKMLTGCYQLVTDSEENSVARLRLWQHDNPKRTKELAFSAAWLAQEICMDALAEAGQE